jgi:hypothetical protein
MRHSASSPAATPRLSEIGILLELAGRVYIRGLIDRGTIVPNDCIGAVAAANSLSEAPVCTEN